MNTYRIICISFLLSLSFSLQAQEYFANEIKPHNIENPWLLKAIRQLISEESRLDQDFQNGRGYIVIKKKSLAIDSVWYQYELHVQYAAIDQENDVLFPEYYGAVDKRLVMFFLDDMAHYKYKKASKIAFLKKLERYLAPKETVTKIVNGKKVRDKDFRPDNKFKMKPQRIILQYQKHGKPIMINEYGVGTR